MRHECAGDEGQCTNDVPLRRVQEGMTVATSEGDAGLDAVLSKVLEHGVLGLDVLGMVCRVMFVVYFEHKSAVGCG